MPLTPEEIVEMTVGMPTRELEPGDVLFAQGDDARSAALLVSGSFRVELNGQVLADVSTPGSFVGEIGALVDSARTADVVATAPSVVRTIGDPESFFETHPQLALELSRQLAARLQRLLAYLGDLRSQYAGDDGQTAIADAVLGRLASRPAVEIDGGSDRAPDYP